VGGGGGSTSYVHILDRRMFDVQKPLNFEAPTAVELTGDFACKTIALPQACVDVTLTLPPTCFYHKDYLNHRYHAKRALYLVTVATALKKTATFKQQRWEYIHDDPRYPAGCGVFRPRTGIPSIGRKLQLTP